MYSYLIRYLFILYFVFFAVDSIYAQNLEHSNAKTIMPVVEFPQFGIDDTTVYSGYVTRFYKDIKGNTTQVTIDSKNKRVTNLFADAANESVSFSWRNLENESSDLKFTSPKVRAAEEGNSRTIEYTFSTSSSSINLGLFLLSTMRVERDFRYKERYSLPLNTEPVFEITEFKNMIESLSRLPESIRNEHLTLLNAASIAQLKQRLSPEIRLSKQNEFAKVTIQQVPLDGKNHLFLEIKVDTNRTEITQHGNYLSLSSRNNEPIEFNVKVGTDSKALSPLSADKIFNKSFWSYYLSKKNENDSLMALSKKTSANEKTLTNFRKLERQIKSIELLSSKEKLMAGLPNFATYFGRDMMMTALMMQPIWSPQMLEYVISSVIKKLGPDGNVSHEEGLAIQAMRENANKYNVFVAALLEADKLGGNEKVLEINKKLKRLLANIQTTTENYHMIDDDFMLPILTAHLLKSDQLSRQEKIEYLLSYNDEHFRRINLLAKNFNYVLRLAHPYANESKAVNLVGFEKLEKNEQPHRKRCGIRLQYARLFTPPTAGLLFRNRNSSPPLRSRQRRDCGRNNKWRSSSWRDSQTGYANGRFAMDVNAIFVPKALEALITFFDFLNIAGVNSDSLRRIVPEIEGTILDNYITEPSLLKNAVKVWRSSLKHFQVTLTEEEALNKIKDKLDWLNNDEKEYWKKILKNFHQTDSKINFLALSLDSVGRPIPVVNTDPAMFLFLENFTQRILEKKEKPSTIYNLIEMFTKPYPLGLFIDGVGPVVANDAYSLPDVWKGFKLDTYHSPHTVWGREVNLFIIGISSQILNAYDTSGRLKSPALKEYVHVLRMALNKIVSAVEKSGLKENELWSYKISNGKIEPQRYSTTSDIQLWNLTDLSAQFLLDKISNVKQKY